MKYAEDMKIDWKKPRVDLVGKNVIGLIIAHPSGVYYGNQIGGLACEQGWLEGIYIPFDDSQDNSKKYADGLRGHFAGPKYRGSCCSLTGIDEETAMFLDNFFGWYTPYEISVDRGRLKDSMEAWIFVTVNPNSNVFTGLGDHGVVTWQNSD